MVARPFPFTLFCSSSSRRSAILRKITASTSCVLPELHIQHGSSTNITVECGQPAAISTSRSRFADEIHLEFTEKTPRKTTPAHPTFPSLIVTQLCDLMDKKPWGIETVEALQKSRVLFDSSIVYKVLERVKSTDSALGFFNWLQCRGFEHDSRTYSVMIFVLGKAGHLENLENLIAGMPKTGPFRNKDLYADVIYWYARLGNTSGAFKFWENMKQEGFVPSPSLYATIIHLFATEKQNEQAVQCFWQMVEKGPSPSSKVFAVLIFHLLDAGKLDAAYLLFSKLPKIKVVPQMQSFAHLMYAYASVDNMHMVKELGTELREYFDNPGKVFCMAVFFLQKKCKFKEAEIFAEVVWPELSEGERRERVLKVCDSLEWQTPETEDITSLKEQSAVLKVKYCDRLKGDSHCELMQEAKALRNWDVVTKSKFEKVHWDSEMIYIALKSINNVHVAWQFFRWLESRPGFKHEIYNRITMLRRLAQCNLFKSVRELLMEMQRGGVRLCISTFNSIIKDCGLAQNWRLMFWMFQRIKESNLKPSQKTFSVMIRALANGKHHMQAYRWWKTMQENGFQLDTETSTLLIQSLASSGKTYTAQLVFEQMLKSGCSPDVYTYMALIQAHSNTSRHVPEAVSHVYDNRVLSLPEAVPSALSASYAGKDLKHVANCIDAKDIAEVTALSPSKFSKEILTFIYNVLAENLLEKQRATSLVFTKTLMEL